MLCKHHGVQRKKKRFQIIDNMDETTNSKNVAIWFNFNFSCRSLPTLLDYKYKCYIFNWEY